MFLVRGEADMYTAFPRRGIAVILSDDRAGPTAE